MADKFDERHLDAEEWRRLGYSLRYSVDVLDGTVNPVGPGLTRYVVQLIEEAEYLEDAARFLRKVEARLVEGQR